MTRTLFAPPGDAIRLETNDERVVRLAEMLWERLGASSEERGAIRLDVVVRPGAAPGPVPERGLVWEVGEDGYRAWVDGAMALHVDLEDSRASAEVAEGLLDEAPSFSARLLLESPVAILLSRRGFTPLHAGAVVGPRGAVVIRGGPGAGKSTLVAAAWRAGLGVLADESLLVSRADASRIAAAVRDLTLLPDSARLLELDAATECAFTGGEEKRRIDLFPGSTPGKRSARRAATILLGPRSPGRARLVTLEREEFLEAFRRGEIPQERQGGDPDAVADAWADGGSWRLDGAEDLEGAVSILRGLAA